jgi:hypothetical protein
MYLRLLLVFLIGCSFSPKVQNPPAIEPVGEEGPRDPSTPIGPEYPVANAKKIFTVKIEDTNYTAAQKLILREAEIRIAQIFNSPEFEAEILSRKFTSTKLLPHQIYEKLFSGAEALIPAVNYQMDLKVTMYYKYNRVVGYTTASSMVVHTNSKFHNNFSPCRVASNLTHEWSHKMGFDHSSASDAKSVPYSLNEIVEKLCK